MPLAAPSSAPPIAPFDAPQNASDSQPDLHAALHEVFGFPEFRALQEEAISAAVAGRDVLVVMPTGAGKSLCFQLPSALSDGLTLVVSPLVALMRDQVTALQSRTTFRTLGCAYLNSLQSPDEQSEILEMLAHGELKLLYVAPERFRSQAFSNVLSGLKIARFVVDEAHCISEWGHDFRPDYLTLRSVVDDLGNPPLLAVTATATLRVQESIVNNLGMREPLKLVGGFNRPNLHFAVHRCKNESERQTMLARALPKLAGMGGSGLIYAATRKQCEEVAAIASRALAPMGKSASAYHAGIDASSRNALQSRWLSGDLHLLVATNAFGMGIDKPDVRYVIHYVYPDSLESYYQEAGRAGRDGRKSRCVILYHFSDRRTREWFIENDALTPDDVQTAHRQICLHKEEKARIPRGWWQQALNWNEVKARLALGELERAGLIQRLGETGDETVLKILRRDFPREALHKITNDLARQREERLRRLDEMVGYCKTTQCRRRTTLSYFGDLERPEPTFAGEKKFCCDNCEAPKSTPEIGRTFAEHKPQGAARVKMPLRVEAEIFSILEGLDALFPQVGKARLGKLLRGANSKDVQRFKAENCPLFGVLKGASAAQAETFLDELIARGLLHQADEEDYFVCRVTRAGREAWQERAPLDITVPGAPLSRDELEESDDDLYETLRDWRRQTANAANLPPYCVLGDKTLLALTQARPQSETALRAISGIGDAKIEKYGDDLLRLLREA